MLKHVCTSYVETFPAADVTVVVFHDPTAALYISCSIFEINAGKDTTTRLSLWSEASITSCHGSSRSSFMSDGKWRRGLVAALQTQLPVIARRLQTLAVVPVVEWRPPISPTNIIFCWSSCTHSIVGIFTGVLPLLGKYCWTNELMVRGLVAALQFSKKTCPVVG